MKLILALAIAVILLMVMAPIALAADSGTTVYVSVSVDGKLLVAAQPVDYTKDMTLEDVIKAAHVKYYSGGESGYTVGTNNPYNMYLFTKCWGVEQIPYLIINDAPLQAIVNTVKVAANDNIIICTASTQGAAKPVSLKATLSGDSATVTATAWTLNPDFTYSHAPLANANVIDPITGKSLGTTDANGSITVTVPASGIVAIEGLAAINVKNLPTSAPAAPTSAPAGTTTVPEGTISYKDAKNHIGETVTIEAQVFDKMDNPSSSMWVLYFGGPVSDPNLVGIEVLYSDLSKFPTDLYVGKTIRITGKLHTNPLGGASFSLTDPSQVQEVSGAPTSAAPTSAAPASSAPAGTETPLIYDNTISLIIVGVVLLTPIIVIAIVKMVRQSRLDKPAAASKK